MIKIRLSVCLHLSMMLMPLAQAQATQSTPYCRDYFSQHPSYGHYIQMEKDGTLTDKQTGLMWYRCNAGELWKNDSCNGQAKKLSFIAAQEYADQLKIGNRENWRIPSIDELKTLVEKSCRSPSINTQAFPSAKTDTYWSSTKNSFNKAMAWSLFFYNGTDFSRHLISDTYLVLLVRTIP